MGNVVVSFYYSVCGGCCRRSNLNVLQPLAVFTALAGPEGKTRFARRIALKSSLTVLICLQEQIALGFRGSFVIGS